MKQLAGLDAAFLHLETAEMPMHVGALHVLELAADYDGDFLQDLRDHMAARLPLAPVLRRRLGNVPLNLANPTWVDAEPDLDVHIVGHMLPPGSGLAALEHQVGLLHPQLLDRRLPLWKFHVFLGLEAGPEGQRQVGLYSQLHHAAVDGQAAVALAGVILDLSPQAAERRLPATRARQLPLGAAGLLRGAIAHQWQQTLKLAKALPAAAGSLGMMATRTALDAAGSSLHDWISPETPEHRAKPERVSNLGLAPRTRLNTSVSAERSFSTVSLSLVALNRTRRLHGASLNDAVLFICGGALRRLFAKQGPLPRKSLVAAVPVSMRAGGDASANTQATMSLVSLGTHLADPAKRLAHVLAASAAMKSELNLVKDLMPGDYPSIGVPWLMQAGALLYGRLRAADKLPVLANLVISNVPGPTAPLYLAGTRMLSNYPASIVVHGLALNITVQSYDKSLDFGLTACAQALPETAALAAYIETAFMEFLALPVAQEMAPPAKPPRKRAAAKR